MKKIGVISDAHGNLQALEVALEYLKQQNCDEIIHTGDVVSIGGQSLECLALLLQNNVVCLMGNHDRDFALDVAFHKPFSHVSERHKRHVFDTLAEYRKTVEKFPLFAERKLGNTKVVFEHYCRTGEAEGFPFKKMVNVPSAEVFDEMYKDYDCDAVFFGHKHEPCDVVENKLYVDVGSVGCHPQPLACGVIITYDNHFGYERFALPYDQEGARQAMHATPDGDYLFDFYYLHKNPPKPWEEDK